MALTIIMAMMLAQTPGADAPAKLIVNPAGLIQRGDYPALAMIDDLEGATGIAIAVGADARPKSCRITATSGSALLDTTTCTLLMRRARFAPALRGGTPTAGEWRNRVRWVLASQYVMVDPRFGGPARTSATANDAFRLLSPDAASQAAGIPAGSAATTFIRLDIDRGGAVTACELDGGSASAAQAGLACPMLMGKDLFTPGFDREGNAVPDRVRVKIRW